MKKLTMENMREEWKLHLASLTREEFAQRVYDALPPDSPITLEDLLKPPTTRSAPKPPAKISGRKRPGV